MALTYKRKRLLLIDELRKAAEAEDDDDYGAAYDALVEFECEAGEFDDYPQGVCRGCGCTDLYGCDGGCEWVDARHTICSNCLAPEERTVAGEITLFLTEGMRGSDRHVQTQDSPGAQDSAVAGTDGGSRG